MAQNDDKFIVRLPDGLRKKLAEQAKNARRSMNSEFIVALEAHLAKQARE